MKIVGILLFFVSINTFVICSSYRILAIYTYPGRSHFIMINSVLNGLASEGHQVDLISAIRETQTVPNLTQIITLQVKPLDFLGPNGFAFIKNFNRNLGLFLKLGCKLCEQLGNPELMDLIKNPPKDRHYDVIITHMLTYPCFNIIGHLWKVPIVSISTTSLYPWMHDMIGNPENIAFSPNNMIPVSGENDFPSRFLNTFWFYLLKFNYLHYTTNQNELLQEYFGSDVPSIRELVLMNTYFAINRAKPMATNLIEIGGIHIHNDGEELSHELKKWLDECIYGVVYFTFGSIFQIETFPEETVKIIFSSLQRFSPVRVLIRIADPTLLTVKMPRNFHSFKWISQEEVLQHHNARVFVTNGGLLGTQGAIYYGVPMLCIPLVADQSTNTKNYLAHKIAIAVNIMTLTQENFDYAINEVLDNPIYT